jgi:signal transduction histidine kinase
LDGKLITVEGRGVKTLFKGRDAVQVAIRDITERRSMENAIREASRKLNLLNSITRHDVVNQLTVLQGYIQIAAMKKPDPVTADFLVKIEAAAKKIGRQIEFTRTYQELGIKVPAWFRIDEVVSKAGPFPVRFSGTCKATEIFADPMFEQVFFNLFDNAVRHGERMTEIIVRCEREPDGLLVIVEDNGIGIPLPEKEKIFLRGYGKHTGLGLFLAREILAITGITIKETGKEGKGARFEIFIPKGAYRFGSG